jgi:hypothetical protein
VILRRSSIQVFKGGRCVVDRRRVDSNDAAVVGDLKARPQLQSRNALLVHGHEMKAVRRNLQRDLLNGTTVAAREQRGLSTVLGKQVARRNRKRARHLRSWRRHH